MPKLLHARFLLCLPVAALVLGAGAAPVIAEPGSAPGAGTNDNRAQAAVGKPSPKPNPNKPAAKPKKPKKSQGPRNAAKPGKSNQGKPPAHAGTRGPKHATPPGGGGAGAGSGAQQSNAPGTPGSSTPATNQGSKLGKVVVCKWVRKPGVAEVPSHIIVVNANALEGKGFAGRFPFPFSDGQVNSVAIRWAEKGESAREIDDAACAAAPVVALADGPASAPADPSAVLGVEETAPGADPVTAEADSSDDGILPATGAQGYLQLLLALGGLAVVVGALLLMRSRLRRSTPGT